MIPNGLEQSLEEILACPACKNRLALEKGDSELKCTFCQGTYPIKDGIPVLFKTEQLAQEEERQFRDLLALRHAEDDTQNLMELIAKHHCVPLMRGNAAGFRNEFKASEWILDIGIGWGWHWRGLGEGAKIIGIDISLASLQVAQRLIGKNNPLVTLVCADSAALPIKGKVISGIWSVQVFQHIPLEVISSVQADLERVLRDNFVMEIYNLNPAWLPMVIYRVLGREFHCRGKQEAMELNLFSAREWAEIWKTFHYGNFKMQHIFSELFFHPNFRVRPRRYPLKLEQAIATYAPKLAKLFSRQIQMRIESA